MFSLGKVKEKKKLNKREKEILLFLYKFRVAEIKTIQRAVKYKNYVYTTEVLKKLYREKFLIRYRLNIYEPYQYSLSYKGFRFFGINGYEYEFLSQKKKQHLLHSKLVSLVMRDNPDISFNNFLSQREMLSHYHKHHDGFYHYRLPIFICDYNAKEIFFDFMINQSIDIDTYVLKIKDIIHYIDPSEFVIFNDVFKKHEIDEIKKRISKPMKFHRIDYINKDNNFSLSTLQNNL